MTLGSLPISETKITTCCGTVPANALTMVDKFLKKYPEVLIKASGQSWTAFMRPSETLP